MERIVIEFSISKAPLPWGEANTYEHQTQEIGNMLIDS